jgi:hypothetical protein
MLYENTPVKHSVSRNDNNNYNDRVKEDEMSRECSTNGGEEECI